jgi:LPS-assembly lipoprotein
MLLSKRQFLTGGAMVCLSACGYSPAYAPGGVGDRLRGKIRVSDPGDSNSFAFVERFEARMGVPTQPTHDLAYGIGFGADGVSITADQVTQRFNLTGQLTYSITQRPGNVVVTQGVVESFTSYSTTSNITSTRAAEQDAYRRLVTILADQLVTELLASADRWLP